MGGGLVRWRAGTVSSVVELVVAWIHAPALIHNVVNMNNINIQFQQQAPLRGEEPRAPAGSGTLSN